MQIDSNILLSHQPKHGQDGSAHLLKRQIVNPVVIQLPNKVFECQCHKLNWLLKKLAQNTYMTDQQSQASCSQSRKLGFVRASSRKRWTVRPCIDQEGERNIRYKGVETSPSRHILKTLRENSQGKAEGEQYLLTVSLDSKEHSSD